MDKLNLTIDGQAVTGVPGSTVLTAAEAAGIYIPRICHHPDLPAAGEVIWAEQVYQADNLLTGERCGKTAGDDGHCGLCLVEVGGEVVTSCSTPVTDGMVVTTTADAVIAGRRANLSRLLATHPHACLTCAQKEGCSRTDCSANVPVDERCCVLLGRCELEKVSDFIGIPGDTPRYVPRQLGRTEADPLYNRDFNLCISCLRCVAACDKVQPKQILGAVWNGDRAVVGTLGAPDLKTADCRFCGACVEVCPTGTLLDKDGVELVRCGESLPCVAQCPAGINIPRYLAAIAAGQDAEALEIIRASVPFPGILGYTCFHPCEATCRRGDVDQPIAICELKRYAADSGGGPSPDSLKKLPATDKKVAIIGSGPTGATAAYYLSRRGHQVSLFDAENKPGGMLRYGIPAYRLPEEVLDREMAILHELGVEFFMDHRFGTAKGAEQLKAEGFDAVLVACGASASKSLPLENAEAEGIYLALDFLRAARLATKPILSGQVVVIGGGNVAIDAAMTARRTGAESVHVVCLESKSEMPAHDYEIKQAEEEGIEFHPGWGPIRFMGDAGRVSGVELKRCTAVFDSQGQFDPKFDETELLQIKADAVIVAIGQEALLDLLPADAQASNRRINRSREDDDLTIGTEGMFSAGDFRCGPSSVVDAIADGRRAADVIDKYLGGSGTTTPIENAVMSDYAPARADDQFCQPRQSGLMADPVERVMQFDRLQATLTESEARIEASRCLRCFIRQSFTAITLPPEKWLPFDAEAVASIPETEGVFQLLDADKQVLRITGAMNLRQSLTEGLEEPGEACWFIWEEDPMFTKRESELIGQYLQQHGELPGGGDDDLDDLF